MAAEKEKQSKKSFGNLALILFILALGVMGIYFGYSYIEVLQHENTVMNLPVIHSKMQSSSDEDSYYLSTDLVIEFEGTFDISRKQLEEDSQNILDSLDYDEATSARSMDYIKQSLQEELEKKYDAKIHRILITDINSGKGYEPNLKSTQESQRDETFNGLFKNAR